MLETYDGFVTLGVIGAMLLAGVLLRTKVKIFQTYMIPAAILGGVVGFILVNSGIGGLQSDSFLPFTLHAFSISFMSLCLTNPDPSSKLQTTRKEYLRGAIWMTMIWTASFALQAIAGAFALAGYNLFSSETLDLTYGFLVTHGFTQGPGQGLAIGNIWEEKFGMADASSLGLVYANIGFVVAFIIGVPIARWFVAKNLHVNKKAELSDDFLRGTFNGKQEHSMGFETTHTANIDTLAVHIAVLGVAYFITYQWLSWANGNLSHIPVLSTMCGWGFFFLHGLVISLLLRFTMNKLGCSHLLNIGVQKHITGTAVDVMLVSSFMSVKMSVLSTYIVPITLVSLAATIVTFALVWYFGRQLTHLGPERMIAQLGCCCGATGNGLLLLRILDPDYSSSVSMELAFFNVAIIATSLPLFAILAPIIPSISSASTFGYYMLYGIVSITCIIFLSRIRLGNTEHMQLQTLHTES